MGNNFSCLRCPVGDDAGDAVTSNGYCGGEIVVNIPEPSSDDYYDIGTKPGLHLIFSQENFFHHNTRTGTEADAVRLKKTFSLFGMDCVVFRDQTLDEIKQILKNVSSTRDFAKDKMLIITVLTHGNEVNGVHKLYAKDREYDANLLWQSFSPSANTNLACKPKWVNIVACRGSKVDPGFLVHERTSTDGVGGQIANAYKLPMEADILISNSTDSGYYSFRNNVKGSVYIQTLCNVLEKYHATRDLAQMLTKVQGEVAKEFKSRSSNPELDDMKQMPSHLSKLRKLIKFTRVNLTNGTGENGAVYPENGLRENGEANAENGPPENGETSV